MRASSIGPEAEPASLAPLALERATAPVTLSMLDKRRRMGTTNVVGPTRSKRASRCSHAPVGTVITLEHEQYALTYGMMCGIRDSAGLQHPFQPRLTLDDFMRMETKRFPAPAPRAPPFQFKDYSPDVFRHVRHRFGIDLAEYMLTLSGDFHFIEFMSNSKSGQCFFSSHDGRFMIKTQTKDESKFLRRMLPHYYQFVMEHPHTLLTRFYGLHRVKMHHRRRTLHFVIMASVFDTALDVHARFDLKGSRIGRHASPSEQARGSAGVLKDNDWLDKGCSLELGAARRAMFLLQLRKDVDFLRRMKIMDYSLLLGVHDSGTARLETRSTGAEKTGHGACASAALGLPTTRTFRSTSMPDDETNGGPIATIHTCLAVSPRNTPTWNQGCVDPHVDSEEEDADLEDDSTSSEGEFRRTCVAAFGDAMALPTTRRSVRSLPSTPSRLATLPPLSPRLVDTRASAASSASIFCRDDGGMAGRDRDGRKNGLIYFVGIIDILQQYNTRKIAETFLKGLRHNRKQISAVEPDFYGDRFLEFIETHVVPPSPY
ncbi:hypothetical protein PsorP6_010776 [Peronosclerospora sorghi]|uniref:Uncharacterized protein n=1 Tax=Peronosclerospora sorghi TaxID=230839 RepID=A0ACC0VZR7_9STRA|nr:hypothetical protein PsorP6_010776 [Peronosclerospora sorghi]